MYTPCMIEFLQQPLVFYSLVLVATIISAATGIVIGVWLIALASLSLGAKAGVGLMTTFFLFQNINKIIIFRDAIRWRIGLHVIVWSIPGALLGSYFLTVIPDLYFEKFLAAFILVYVLYDVLFAKEKEDVHVLWIPVASVLYGFTSGLTGSGNIVKGPLFTTIGLRKEAFIGTYALTSLAVNLTKASTYNVGGTFSIQNSWTPIAILCIISIVGTYIGKHWLRSINERVFYWIVNISFIVSAVLLLLK